MLTEPPTLHPLATAVSPAVDSLLETVRFTTPGAAIPGRVKPDSAGVSELLRLARPLYSDDSETVEKVALHLAVMSLWCPKPEEHHAHHETPVVAYAPDVDLLLAQDVNAGNYSMRGLASRYRHLGVDRSQVYGVLRRLAPDYLADVEQRHGPGRLTIHYHEANRRRRRVDRRYATLREVPDKRLRRMMMATGRYHQF